MENAAVRLCCRPAARIAGRDCAHRSVVVHGTGAMRTSFARLLVTLTLLGAAPWARATLSCTAPVSTGFSTAYAAAGFVPNVSQGTVSFNCTRSAATDATSILLTANNGAHAAGTQNQAANGKSR